MISKHNGKTINNLINEINADNKAVIKHEYSYIFNRMAVNLSHDIPPSFLRDSLMGVDISIKISMFFNEMMSRGLYEGLYNSYDNPLQESVGSVSRDEITKSSEEVIRELDLMKGLCPAFAKGRISEITNKDSSEYVALNGYLLAISYNNNVDKDKRIENLGLERLPELMVTIDKVSAYGQGLNIIKALANNKNIAHLIEFLEKARDLSDYSSFTNDNDGGGKGKIRRIDDSIDSHYPIPSF